MKYVVVALLFAMLVSVGCSAYAGDIVTVPTANQLKKGQVDVAYYYIGLDKPSPQPQHVLAQTLYVGLTDQIELDVHRYEVDNDKTSAIVNVSFLLLKETATLPDVVIGGRNILGQETSNVVPDTDKQSFFISAAKILNMPASGPPKPPFVRLHLSLGTQDNTLLGEERHEGLFGGVQALLTKTVGAIALWDGQDLITGLTFTPEKSNFTIKGGGYGEHWWVGLSYAKSMF